ncbi:MAG: shikimate dehydrogenase [Steroidobacteraceae bacterium]
MSAPAEPASPAPTGAQADEYGVIGHPVTHSWSPFIHELFARETRQALLYRRHDVVPARFREYVLDFAARGGRGLNVTVPHKGTAAQLADELTARAERAGAVNTLTFDHGRIRGDNTDGAGLVTDLREHLALRLGGARILLAGAGGAARGVLGPVLELGPAEVLVANRTSERAHALAGEFASLGSVRGCGFGELPRVAFDLIVNATAASLSGDVPPIPHAAVGSATVCYDMAYSRSDTPFVSWARERGCHRAMQGWVMLVEQAAESFAIWRGMRPSTAPVLELLARTATEGPR